MLDKKAQKCLARLATEHRLEPATLMAVCEVESGSRLFAKVKGRDEPLIRFEGHYFYRLLDTARRNKAVVKGLADRRAGKVANPRTQAGRWKMLGKAMEIDRDAALQSVSWGLGQVMGIHWRWLGYASVDAMVASVRSGLEGQAEAMVRYIDKAGLTGLLAEHDWAGFARGYNGPQYARLGYHRKLARAYKKWTGGKADKPAKARRRAYILRFGEKGEAVRDLQIALRQLGYPLVVDGDFGPATRRAVVAFQQSRRLIGDGLVGPRTFEAMTRNQTMPASIGEQHEQPTARTDLSA